LGNSIGSANAVASGKLRHTAKTAVAIIVNLIRIPPQPIWPCARVPQIAKLPEPREAFVTLPDPD
jgi:hypothetical protein